MSNIQVKIDGQSGWKQAVAVVVTDGKWNFDCQPKVTDIRLVDESECEPPCVAAGFHLSKEEIMSFECNKPKKIEKLEPRDMINSVNVSDKINEIIEAKDKESRKIDEEIDSIWDSIKDIWEAIKEKHSTIEKLETSKFDSTYDNILIDKINELIEAKDKESRKFDKLSQLVTSEQTVILLVNVFGAEAVKDFLLEEAEKKGEENDTR